MCPAILSDYLGAPRVEFVTTPITAFAPLHNVPSPLSYVPMSGSGSSDRMTFLERVKNVVLYGSNIIMRHFVLSPPFDAIKTKYNIKPGRSFLEAKADAELVIHMNDFALTLAQPVNPGNISFCTLTKLVI